MYKSTGIFITGITVCNYALHNIAILSEQCEIANGCNPV